MDIQIFYEQIQWNTNQRLKENRYNDNKNIL
jgi:hypothetical protein